MNRLNRNKNNFSNENSLDNDSINLSSYREDFIIDSDLLIPKTMNDILNLANYTENHGNNLDKKDNDKQEEAIPIIKPKEKVLKDQKTEKSKIKKLLGRKKKGKTPPQKEGSSHDIYAEDNITVKIKTHYLNFIISFLNCIFPHLNYKKKLYKLDKEFKINIKMINSKDNSDSLNDKTIGEIISNKISKKYRSVSDKSNANKKICEEIKNNPILNRILSENYLIFFKNFYYNTDSFINLKDYGLNKIIFFPKNVKNFKHLLKDNENKGEKYIMSIKEHVVRNYIPGLMFLC